MNFFINHKKYILPILNFITLCIIVFAISVFFIHKSNLIIGCILILLSFLCLLSLIPFKIKIKSRNIYKCDDRNYKVWSATLNKIFYDSIIISLDLGIITENKGIYTPLYSKDNIISAELKGR